MTRYLSVQKRRYDCCGSMLSLGYLVEIIWAILDIDKQLLIIFERKLKDLLGKLEHESALLMKYLITYIPKGIRQ